MRAGVGDSTRYIPLHLISERKPELFSVLPAIHILTGCYTTSKVGTKLSALKPSAAQLLSEFGESLSSQNQDEIIRKAVQYLVQVLNPNSTWIFLGMKCTTKVSDLHSLPPTSADIHLHMSRCLYTQPIHRCIVFKTEQSTQLTMAMKSRMAPSFLSTIKTMSQRVLYKHAVVKSV